jgi:hypothetical protein
MGGAICRPFNLGLSAKSDSEAVAVVVAARPVLKAVERT